jgi:hypothetical protein
MKVELDNEDLNSDIDELNLKIKEINELIKNNENKDLEEYEENILLIQQKINNCFLDINDIKIELSMIYDDNNEKKNKINLLEEQLKKINELIINKILKLEETKNFKLEKEDSCLNVKKIKNNNLQKNEIKLNKFLSIKTMYIVVLFLLIILLIIYIYLIK